MKFLLILAVFSGGVFYLFNQQKQDAINKEKIRQAKAEQITMSEPKLPATQEKSIAMDFSPQTLATLRTLTTDSNEKVRVASAELLWQIQDPSAGTLIRNMFETETEASTKTQLIDMLQRQKNLMSLALIEEALKDFDKSTRIRAVDAIGTFGTKEAIPALNKALADYDEEVRLRALKAVDSIRRQIEELKQRQLRELEEGRRNAALKVE